MERGAWGKAAVLPNADTRIWRAKRAEPFWQQRQAARETQLGKNDRPSDWDECSRFTPDRTTKVTVSFRKRVSENNGNDFAAVASRFLHRRGSKLSKFTNGSKASAWSNSLASRIIKEPRKPILSSKTLRSRASAASNVSRNYLV
eukprot:GEMP01035984.1.p1 GENE.GEMP01035984.1~~GEMP01035984.1.p1  ORF type:complete len:145 (+),score=29.25 GEMP01035984.1:471-905(+)